MYKNQYKRESENIYRKRCALLSVTYTIIVILSVSLNSTLSSSADNCQLRQITRHPARVRRTACASPCADFRRSAEMRCTDHPKTTHKPALSATVDRHASAMRSTRAAASCPTRTARALAGPRPAPNGCAPLKNRRDGLSPRMYLYPQGGARASTPPH